LRPRSGGNHKEDQKLEKAGMAWSRKFDYFLLLISEKRKKNLASGLKGGATTTLSWRKERATRNTLGRNGEEKKKTDGHGGGKSGN